MPLPDGCEQRISPKDHTCWRREYYAFHTLTRQLAEDGRSPEIVRASGTHHPRHLVCARASCCTAVEHLGVFYFNQQGESNAQK
jgi:hypothetical protein